MTIFRIRQSGVRSPSRMHGFILPLSTFGAAACLFLLAACNAQDTPVASAADTVEDVGYKTAGNFACHQGHPWQAVQITSSADVPAGGTAKISVQTPPHISSTLTADRMYVFCQVDEQRCTGTSCNGNPPVDFIGSHGDGLTWESVRSETGDARTVFTAIVHNSDVAMAHHATLTLDLPAPS